jgi:hypothetical protein
MPFISIVREQHINTKQIELTNLEFIGDTQINSNIVNITTQYYFGTSAGHFSSSAGKILLKQIILNLHCFLLVIRRQLNLEKVTDLFRFSENGNYIAGLNSDDHSNLSFVNIQLNSNNSNFCLFSTTTYLNGLGELDTISCHYKYTYLSSSQESIHFGTFKFSSQPSHIFYINFKPSIYLASGKQ